MASSWTSKAINYITFVLLILIIGTQAYNLYYTRNDSFPGVWIVRSVTALLICSFLLSFVYSAFLHRFTLDQLPPCTSIAYFRFRWYIVLMAVLGLAAIPVYLAVLQKTTQNRLLLLLASQIQVNLFTVLLCVGLDALTRYFYTKQQHQQQQSQPFRAQSPAPNQNNDPQYGYFSPKTKGPAPLSSAKNPFESNKFRYAR